MLESIKCLRKREMGHRSEKGVQTEKEVGDIQTQTLMCL